MATDDKTKYNRILIDLDSLLDIRQGILHKLLDEEKLSEFIASETYNFRTTDDFSSIVDQDKYELIELNRTQDIVLNSTISYLYNILRRKLIDLEKRNNYFQETKDVELIINIYPFKLTTEQQDLLINGIFKKLNLKIFIKCIYIETFKITPLFLRDNDIVEVFLYDATTWLDTQLDNVYNSSFKIHDIRINFPSIYKKELTEDMKKKLDDNGFKDIFSVLEYLVSAYAIINFLPVMFYNNLIISTVYIDNFNKTTQNKSIKELFPDIPDDVELPDLPDNIEGLDNI